MHTRELCARAFLHGYGRHADCLSPAAIEAIESAADEVERFVFTDDGDVKAWTPKFAGITVQAKDTGRILLMQRLLDDTDPASGMWEAPGGHLEDDESPWDGAKREWEEEVGLPLPRGTLVDTAEAPNGYVSHLYAVPDESAVPLTDAKLDRTKVPNPDNPHGKQTESLAWWNPDDARRSSAVREEFRRHTPWAQWFGINPLEGIFEAIEHKGELLGLHTKLFLRRDRIWLKYDNKARAWTRALAVSLPVDRLAHALVGAAKATPEALSPQAKDRRDALTAAAVSFLWHHMNQEDATAAAIRGITLDALQEGSAEGTASASALTAMTQELPAPDLDAMRAENLKNLRRYNVFADQASEDVRQQIDGLAGDLSIHIGHLIDSGADFSDIEDAVGNVLAAGDGVAFYLDQAVHLAYTSAQKDYYEQSGVGLVDFVTVGDDRVCPRCFEEEADNPHTIDDLLAPPIHGGCRCILQPSDDS